MEIFWIALVIIWSLGAMVGGATGWTGEDKYNGRN
jgi:hypothetical protein